MANLMKLKAVILLSGGLDSTTILAIARSEGFELITLSFDYGQRHQVELDRAQVISEKYHALEHRVVTIDLKQFGGSALTADIAVPTGRDPEEMSEGIPITYVPARNTIFLSLALACAETVGAQHIFIGVNAVDYSGYPDCRPEFIYAFENLANIATQAGVEGNAKYKIHTPLIDLTKAEIIQTGIGLDVDYSLTHSCYNPGKQGIACGICDSCQLRLKGFAEAGLEDPIDYQIRNINPSQ